MKLKNPTKKQNSMIARIFSVCAPPPPLLPYAPPVTESVPLYSKPSLKNMARVSGGPNNMRPLIFFFGGGGGAHKRKRSDCPY